MDPMAIFATLFGLLGRFAGRALTTTLGWASTLLFGRVRSDRQIVLAAVTFGSVVWLALIAGVLVPDVGTLLLGFIPVPDFVDPLWVRLAMLAGALILPLVVGVAVLMLLDRADRPRGTAMVTQVLRGYPLTLALAVVLGFLAVIGTVRKLRVLARRWSDVHIPVVVRPGGYDTVLADLERALDDAGLAVDPRDAPAVLAMPGRLLAGVAGPGVRRLVPERLRLLSGPGLEVLVHQSDIAISGGSSEVARARAAIASRLTSTAASRTTSDEAQAIELRIERLARPSEPGGTPGAAAAGALSEQVVAELAEIDRELARLEIDADEWEVLYRIRLQAERDLRAGSPIGGTFPGDGDGPAAGTAGFPNGHAPAGELGLAAGVAALLALDIVVAVRERFARRS